MPPYLATPYFHLSRLPLTTRIVLTFFSISISSGIIFVGFAYYPSRADDEEQSVKNFTGNKEQKLLGLKADFAKHQLVENTESVKKGMNDLDKKHAYNTIHPHSFLMPVLYFILCHLCEMTTMAVWFKMMIYSVSFVSMMTTVFAPYLIYSSIKFAAICYVSFYTMLGTFLLMVLAPTFQMWRNPHSGKQNCKLH